MKSLEEYIRRNPEHFETEEPLQGHFERFDEKLEKVSKRKIISTGSIVLRIAAAVILMAALSFAAIREFRLIDRNLGQIFAASHYPELNEAEQFYNTQLDLYYGKLQNLKFDNDKVQKQQILDELSDMDKQVKTMKRDLLQNPDDERVVHAIINYYQVKLEFMDMVITRTQESINTIL